MKKILVALSMIVCVFAGALGYKYFVENGKVQDGVYVSANDYNDLSMKYDSVNYELANAFLTIERIMDSCNAECEETEDDGLLNAIRKDAVLFYALPFSVFFKNNSVELDETDKEIIRNIAIEINLDTTQYILYGFGDYANSEIYNQVISGARCESVKKELIKYGVEEEKIKIIVVGENSFFGDKTSYINKRVSIARKFWK